jgi:hypothetical protein
MFQFDMCFESVEVLHLPLGMLQRETESCLVIRLYLNVRKKHKPSRVHDTQWTGHAAALARSPLAQRGRFRIPLQFPRHKVGIQLS